MRSDCAAAPIGAAAHGIYPRRTCRKPSGVAGSLHFRILLWPTWRSRVCRLSRPTRGSSRTKSFGSRRRRNGVPSVGRVPAADSAEPRGGFFRESVLPGLSCGRAVSAAAWRPRRGGATRGGLRRSRARGKPLLDLLLCPPSGVRPEKAPGRKAVAVDAEAHHGQELTMPRALRSLKRRI